MSVRREPFLVFFPLAVVLGTAGVLPWLLFGRGLQTTWPGTYHALTMTQSFLAALAVGFLGTMIPRRMRAAPMSWLEIGLLVVGLAAIPACLRQGWLVTGELAFLGVLATLAQFVVRRAASASDRRPPPSFVLIPIGLALGCAGAGLLIAFLRFHTPPWTFELGRQLAQQGLLLGLVLALAPLLLPLIGTGEQPAERPGRRWVILAYAGAGLLLLLSFILENRGWVRSGLGLRGALCLGVLLTGGLLAPVRKRGLHRLLFRLALVLVPIGLLAAAAEPLRRVPLLHVTFISGLFLLAFSVSLHVTFLHTGHDRLADSWPWPVALVALLTLGAAGVRVYADAVPRRYFESLTLAAELWLAAALVWGVYLVPKIVRRKTP